MSFIVLIFQIADRGVSYIYGIFYRFELIDVPDKVKEKGVRTVEFTFESFR